MEKGWLQHNTFLGMYLVAEYSKNFSTAFVVDSVEKLEAVRNNPGFFRPLPITEMMLKCCSRLETGNLPGYFYYRSKDFNLEIRYSSSRKAVRIRGVDDFVGESRWCYSAHELQEDILKRGGPLITLSEMDKTLLKKA